jgi:hypothetical protein
MCAPPGQRDEASVLFLNEVELTFRKNHGLADLEVVDTSSVIQRWRRPFGRIGERYENGDEGNDEDKYAAECAKRDEDLRPVLSRPPQRFARHLRIPPPA